MKIQSRVSLACAMLIASVNVHAAISGLWVFGDSLSDSGNAFLFTGETEVAPYTDIIPDRPYASQTFSDGEVWVQQLASSLGLTLNPSAPPALGTNFALGGSTSGALPAIGAAGTLFPILAQAGTAAGFALPGDGLYVVSGGGNDVRAALDYLGVNPLGFVNALGAMGDGAANIANSVTALAGAGATRFLVGNVADVGRAPAVAGLGPQVAGAATTLAMAFNQELATALQGVRNSLPGIEIIEIDTFSMFNAVLDSPGAFGFTNSSSPCIFENGGLGCSNPDEFIFWDGIHPTSAVHALSAQAALAAVVPLPPAVWLFGVGLAALTRMRRRGV